MYLAFFWRIWHSDRDLEFIVGMTYIVGRLTIWI